MTTENLKSLVAVAKVAPTTTKRGLITVQNIAKRCESDIARIDRMEKALRLIERSDTFCGGTFVRELQEIARRALSEDSQPLLPVSS